MDRIRKALKKQRSSPTYEPLDDGSNAQAAQTARGGQLSWLEYSIFLVLGISMLWAW